MAAAKRFHIKRKTWVGYAFMMPFLILFVLFIILPVFISFGLSFTNYNMIESPDFIGITNYRLLILDDAEFLIALKNTLVFAFISGPIGFLGSFVMAWLINNLKARNLFSLAFYAPSITSGVALSTVWLYFFSSDRYGLINNTLINLGILSEPIQWTQDVNTVLPFGNTLSIIKITGTELLEVLEASTFCTPEAIGGFPQVSGIEFTVDTTKGYDQGDEYPGTTYFAPKTINRVTIKTVGGKDFDPAATYTIATNDFMASGGDTYYRFVNATANYDLGIAMDEVVMQYITEVLGGTVTADKYGEATGRITVVS